MSYRSQVTPHSDRISKISEKLSTIQLGAENERVLKLEHNEHRYRVMEDQFVDFSETLGKKINMLRDTVAKLQRIVDEEKSSREQVLDARQQEIQSLDQKLNHILDSETQSRKETENKIVRLIDDRLSLLKGEIAKEAKFRADSIDSLNNCLEDIPKLNDAIRIETSERDETDQSIFKKANEEITKLNNIVQSEKRSRDESEQAIYDMLKDVVGRVKIEIENERKNRESTEETLLSLLEDTCNKLNAAQLV